MKLKENWTGLVPEYFPEITNYIEKEFVSLFPNSPNALSLESKFPLIRHEMELYQSVLRTEKKWGALKADLFGILRGNGAQDLRADFTYVSKRLVQRVRHGDRHRVHLRVHDGRRRHAVGV